MTTRFMQTFRLQSVTICLAMLFCLTTGRAGAAGPMPDSFSSLVKKGAPGVVNIMATKVIRPSAQEQMPCRR